MRRYRFGWGAALTVAAFLFVLSAAASTAAAQTATFTSVGAAATDQWHLDPFFTETGREAGARFRYVAGTLDLRAELNMKSLDASCPPAFPKTIECHPRTGHGTVSGLGRVTETYIHETTTAAPECGGLVKVLGHTAVFAVEGKGEIRFAVAEAPHCLSADASLRATQTFTVTGGTGIYAVASGSGRIERRASFIETGAIGVDTWVGTLIVAGLAFDVTPPTLKGPPSKTVRIPKKRRSVRVTYDVSATDNADASVPVACKPRSGTLFRPGHTTVTCSATDSSGNTGATAFVIRVKRRP
jgi:hypothetical protein